MSEHLTPRSLKALCQQYRLHPAKGYGQNFLITDAPVKKMIEAAELRADDTVVEIGPGFGVLTFALAEKAGRVVALEIERRLRPYWDGVLEKKVVSDRWIGDIELRWGNALRQLSPITYHLSHYKVVANLPYQITSDVLRTLLELENKPELIVIMVQKEVAERICAKPGEMSLLSVAVQYYGEPKIVARVPAGSFWPRPKVESAILEIALPPLRPSSTSPRAGEGQRLFFRVVKAGFAMKRKQLWRNLSAGLKIDGEKVKKVLLEVMGNEKVRAEELRVDDWRRVVHLITSSPHHTITRSPHHLIT